MSVLKKIQKGQPHSNGQQTNKVSFLTAYIAIILILSFLRLNYSQVFHYTEKDFCFFSNSEQEAREIAASIGSTFQWWDNGICAITAENPNTEKVPLYTDEWIYSEDFEIAQNADDEWHLDAIHAAQAWEISQGEGVLIAVIDTGIDRNHSEFRECLVAAETVIPDDAYQANGYFRPEYQGPEDYLGHGTHVAGLIAARADGTGTTGVAPKARLLSVKALESDGVRGNGKTSWVAAAIGRAVDAGVDIINLSVGGAIKENQLLQEAISRAEEADILVVCAAGNTGTSDKNYPAAYQESVAVSAVRRQMKQYVIASYSNYGDWIDICAPGSNLYATSLNNGYEVMTGTSMACPLVSGGAALLLAEDPSLSSRQLKELLMESSKDLGAEGKDTRYGAGMLDLQNGLQLLKNRGALLAPYSNCPNGSVITDECVVNWKTDSLHGKIYYTLDGTDPDERSMLWPTEGRTFSAGAVELKLAVCGDGQAGETVAVSYTVISAREELTGNSGIRYYQMPTYGIGKRTFQMEVPAGKKLTCTLEDYPSSAQITLYDGNGHILASGQNGKFTWKNSLKQSATVFVEVLMDLGEEFQLKWECTTVPIQHQPQKTDPSAEQIPPVTKESMPTEPQTTEILPTEPETSEEVSLPVETDPQGAETEEPLFQIDIIPNESMDLSETAPSEPHPQTPAQQNSRQIICILLFEAALLIAAISLLKRVFSMKRRR